MNDPNARPRGRTSGRGRGGRRRGDASPDGGQGPQRDDGPERTGNLTTTNALPPVEPPTGFADLGVPERTDLAELVRDLGEMLGRDPEHPPVVWRGESLVAMVDHGRSVPSEELAANVCMRGSVALPGRDTGATA